MESQGPPHSAGDGTKNTSDPRAREPRYENPGGVTSDSLAAESEAFQEGNPNSNPTGVTGASSTYANMDTSSARRLDPAPSAPARDDDDQYGSGAQGTAGTKYPAEGRGGGGQADASPSGFTTSSSGLTSATGGVDNTGYQAHGLQRSSGGDSSGGSGQLTGHADEAPGYITNVVRERTDGPHGKNLTEGGFEGEAGNTLGAEPGSIDDPGRVAVGNFQAMNAKGPGGDGDHNSELDTETRFDELGGDQRT